MAQHVGVEAADTGQLLPVVAGHLAAERALHMYHLVVGDGQHEVLGKCVHHGEGHVVVVVTTEEGVHLQIMTYVIHPAHVPLQVKAQAAYLGGMGHLGPRGGLLRHHQHGGVHRKGRAVKLTKELDGLQVLMSAVLVGPPLLTVIVQIQHGGHRIHAKAVDVVLTQPESGGGQQKAAHIGLTIVKDAGTPALMLPFELIGVLVQTRAVKLNEAVGILAEMGRHPVKDHTDTGAVETIHQIHKVVRRTVTGGGSKVAGTLISPALVQRILRHRQQLHIVVAHVTDVFRQAVAHLPIVEDFPVLGFLPRAQVDLVDVHHLLGGAAVLLPLDPLLIAPFETTNVVDLAVGFRPRLLMEAVGVSFPLYRSIRFRDHILIAVILLGVSNRQFPCAVVETHHAPLLPIAEIADQCYMAGIGCPHTKDPAIIGGMCAEVFVRSVPHAIVE